MFDQNANPEHVAMRASELAIEQLDRLHVVLKESQTPQVDGREFYQNAFEISISNQIAKLMAGYAVLKGWSNREQPSI